MRVRLPLLNYSTAMQPGLTQNLIRMPKLQAERCYRRKLD